MGRSVRRVAFHPVAAGRLGSVERLVRLLQQGGALSASAGNVAMPMLTVRPMRVPCWSNGCSSSWHSMKSLV